MISPAVSVIMSVYNGEHHLAEAVESILDQTFEAFEFIIVDDASTDRTSEILRNYSVKDSRITILTNETNKERSVSRNRAIAHATSDLIAVMDADDVALPDRLAKQVAFMRANPDITVCGGALSIYDRPDEVWLPPTEHNGICAMSLFACCIYHPTVIFKKSHVCAVGGYDAAMPPTEDYDLWARLSMRPDVRFANLPEILCRYRTYPDRKKVKDIQLEKANMVRKKLLCCIGLTPTDKEFAAHLAVSLQRNTLSSNDILACKKWLDKLYAASCASEVAYTESLKYEMQCRWGALCAENITASAFGCVYCSEFAEVSAKRIVLIAKSILKRFWRLADIMLVNIFRKIIAACPGALYVRNAVKTLLRWTKRQGTR